MKKEIAISVKQLSKVYRKERVGSGTIRDTFRQLLRPRKKETFYALKDLDFEVQPGEAVGVIGSNGAGKSTLLKVLSKITRPTYGKAVVMGRIAALLEVGTGFHHELTGRENIFLNGTILGMSRKEIKGKLDEIIDFAGVESYIDMPVKNFSSGMYVRLAFAVAAHLEAEILLIDEVLAVGDISFQKKSLKKMNEVARSGKTVIMVSHQSAVIQELCPKSILLRKGEMLGFGPTEQIFQHYHELLQLEAPSGEFINTSMSGKLLNILSVKIYASDTGRKGILPFKCAFYIEVNISANANLDNLALSLEVSRHTGEWVFSSVSSQDDVLFSVRKGQVRKLTAKFNHLSIRPGTYTLHASVAQSVHFRYCNIIAEDLFRVEPVAEDGSNYQGYWGAIQFTPDWDLGLNAE